MKRNYVIHKSMNYDNAFILCFLLQTIYFKHIVTSTRTSTKYIDCKYTYIIEY